METAGVAKNKGGNMETVDILKKSDVFSHLSEEALAEVAKLCRTRRQRTCM
jgi:hypothetical protein